MQIKLDPVGEVPRQVPVVNKISEQAAEEVKMELKANWQRQLRCNQKRPEVKHQSGDTEIPLKAKGVWVERLGRKQHICVCVLYKLLPVASFFLAWDWYSSNHELFVLFWPGCQRSIGLSNGKAKVCNYSGWYYCSNCHVDDSFLIPARIVHNWDTSKYKVGVNIGLLIIM